MLLNLAVAGDILLAEETIRAVLLNLATTFEMQVSRVSESVSTYMGKWEPSVRFLCLVRQHCPT